MAFVTGDRVKETTTTTGTGNLTLAGAVSGFQAFSIFANNDTFFYAVVHQTAAEWEVGIGTYVSATPALSRTTILESSNSDAAVSFASGTKDVFITHPSAMALQMEQMAAPAAAGTDGVTVYAFESGVPQVRSRDEFGLVDVLSQRDQFRVRKHFYQGPGSDTTADGDTLTWGMNSVVVEGTITGAVAVSGGEGQRKNFATAATLNTDAGYNGPFTATERDWNPDVTVKFRVVSTAVRRVWIGWMEADQMADAGTAATHKFALRLDTSAAETGFVIVHSDGTTQTIETAIQASDANTHTIRLVADNANTRWGWSFDGAAITWTSTNVPGATQLMGLQVQIRTLEGVAKNMDLYFIEGSMEK